MKLTIRHRTTYRYARPVVLQPHRMILRPRSSHDVVVLASSLVCCPDAQLDWTQDVFGNLIATGTFEGPTSELVISSNLIVEQLAEAWPVFGIAPEAHSFPFQYSRDDLADLGALNIPEHDDPEGRLDAWAHAFVRGATTDTLSLLKDLNAGVLGPVAYRVRDEEGTQTPLETLALASGSCRDIAALFIEAIRHLGFGARAVSGYLFDAEARTDDPGSTHAWAEVYLPGAGWIAFDPTHRRLGGRRRPQQPSDHADRRWLCRRTGGLRRHGGGGQRHTRSLAIASRPCDRCGLVKPSLRRPA
jgi:transglutaminase-like putative cysteine protease